MVSQHPHVLVVGGAYGGLSAVSGLIHLSRGDAQKEGPRTPPNVARALRVKPRITVLDERDGFFHSVGAPLGQISKSFANEFWIQYDDIKKSSPLYEDVQFVKGTAVGLDMTSKILRYSAQDSGSGTKELAYDYLVLATGTRRRWPVVPEVLQKAQYTKQVEQLEREISGCSRVVLVGGGAVGIEMSAEMKVHFPHCEVILVHSRDTLLSAEPLTDEYKSIAYSLLTQQGVEVILGQRVIDELAEADGRVIVLSSGETIKCDKVIYTAQQQGANTAFLPPEILDAKGCIQTQETLQFPESLPHHYCHYAVGDAVAWTGIKRSGPAHVMGQFAATNLVSTMIAVEDGKRASDAELVPCLKFEPTMSLAIGEQAIGMRAGLRYGKDVKQRAFGRGLGIDGTLSRLEITPLQKRTQEFTENRFERNTRVNGQAVTANM